MLNRPIHFLASADPMKSRVFYENTLGLTFIADEPFALVFDISGSPLRIQKVQSLQPAPFTVLGWTVADIAAAIRELMSRGVEFEHFPQLPQDEQGVWQAPGGVKVAWFKDPDGNTLSLTEE